MDSPRTRPQRTITPVIHPGDVEYAIRFDAVCARWLVIYRFIGPLCHDTTGMWRDSDIQPDDASNPAHRFPSGPALALAQQLTNGVNL